MWRTSLGAIIGAMLGVGGSVLILRVGYDTVTQLKQQAYELEPNIIYLTITLGAGFGSLCGALAGVASTLAKASHQRPASPPSPVA